MTTIEKCIDTFIVRFYDFDITNTNDIQLTIACTFVQVTIFFKDDTPLKVLVGSTFNNSVKNKSQHRTFTNPISTNNGR